MNGQLHSSIVCVVHNHLGMETGPGFLDFESSGVYSTEQRRGAWSVQNDQNCFILVSLTLERTKW